MKDGNYLQELVEKSIEVDGATVDRTYTIKVNLEYFEKYHLPLYSRFNPNILDGNPCCSASFEYNKDAQMMICPAGYQSTRKARAGKKNQKKNQRLIYYFDINKCKTCPIKEGCYKLGAKRKTYSVTISSDTHLAQKNFQEADEFKAKIKHQ